MNSHHCRKCGAFIPLIDARAGPVLIDLMEARPTPAQARAARARARRLAHVRDWLALGHGGKKARRLVGVGA